MWKKRNKYGAVKTIANGKEFHSRAEAKRYTELLLLERAGAISSLVLQPSFPIQIGEPPETVCTYIGDFQYHEAGKVVVEDVKGKPTDIFKLKKKLFALCYPEIDFKVLSKKERGDLFKA